MFTKNFFRILSLFAFAGTLSALEAAPTPDYKLNFDDVAEGALPPGWKIDATHPGGKLAEWRVAADANATSKPQVLAIAKINDTSAAVFNLCWTKDIAFREGAIEVSLRADSGREDQGGGVIWRVQDADNYYLARYNPLESNFRIYAVQDGDRKALGSAENIEGKAGQWFRLRISQQGDNIEGYLNGAKYLEVTDKTFMEPGGVGLWSKADAVSSFDDFSVVPLSKP